MGIPTEKCNICGGRWFAGDFDECPKCNTDQKDRIAGLEYELKLSEECHDFVVGEWITICKELFELRKAATWYFECQDARRYLLGKRNSFDAGINSMTELGQTNYDAESTLRALLNKD